MPLQIRRGPTADRLANTPLAGELVYDTTTGSVYVGNGSAAGGLPVTNFSVGDARSTTANMFLGDSLSDNTVHSGITFAYIGNRLQATVQQDLSNYIGLIGADQGFAGNLWADDSGLIVNSQTRTIYGNFVPQGHIVPATNIAHDLGTAAYRFRDLYLSGSSIYLGNAVITSTGTAINFPTGSTIGGQPVGINEGDTYNITISGNVIGTDSTVLVNTANGTFRGDLTGSVFADDSTMLVDGRDGVLRGTLIGGLTGNVTGNLTGVASLATVASNLSLVDSSSSSSLHYLTFSLGTGGTQVISADTSLTYQPSTNTLGLSVLNSTTINGTTVNATSVSATNLTGNIFTSLIDTADSSAITVTPAIIFSSDVTLQNELFVGGDVFPSTSESYNLGSYTKKFSKLYLTEGANALWIGNAAISGSGTTVNLPAGSTVGGSAITTAAGSNATTITVNTTGTSAEYFVSFFDDQTGDNLIYTDDTFKYNPGTGILTVGDAVIGSVTGNLTGNVTGSLFGNANTATTASTVALTATNTTAASHFVTFVDTATGNENLRTDTSLTYNPSTNTLTAGTFTGNVTATDGQIKAVSTSDANVPFRSENYTNTSNSAVNWSWFRSRGTTTVPVAVQSGDNIGRFNFSAWNGTAEQNVARIQVEAGNTTTTGNATGAIRFLTTDQFGTFGTALLISAERNVTLATGDLTVTAGTIVSGEGFQTGSLSIFDNKITTTLTNADIELDPNGTGTVDFRVSQQTTVGAAGVASALPATPSLYFTIRINGTSYVVPAYAVS
jgi:hypothetical protein